MPYSIPSGFNGNVDFGRSTPSPSFVYVDRGGWNSDYGGRPILSNHSNGTQDLTLLKVFAVIGACIIVGYGIYNSYNRKESQIYLSKLGNKVHEDDTLLNPEGRNGKAYTASQLESVDTLEKGKSVTTSRCFGAFGLLCVTAVSAFSHQINTAANITISILGIAAIAGQHYTIPYIYRKPLTEQEYRNELSSNER